tara:strand:+ start:1167 stop:1841 length:675 start_codon:yes stop_codon:yes gene_type:complete
MASLTKNLSHIIIGISLSVFLTSCTAGSIYRELSDNFLLLFSTPDDIPKSQIDSVPFATMQARFGKSKNSLIVLEEVKNDVLKWTSSNSIKIYTKNGYIIKVSGTDNELDLIELDRNHPAITQIFLNSEKTFTSFYNFDNPKLFNLPVKTVITFIENQNIEILGSELNLRLFKEESLENLISWNFINYFWVDTQGRILMSEQYFTPRNPKAFLKLTNPYKKPGN